ncbi:MAG: hypothetical protein GXO85_16125 [Chlorobi bacterium]|nr:hypothetical protein [Chlorobiota bacterium]
MIAYFVSCTEKKEEKYIAKVGDSYLTEAEVDHVMSSNVDSSKFREEYIRQWIEDELLYLAAKKEGILSSKDYKSLTKQSSKMIANSLLIKSILENLKIKDDSSSVRKYFMDNPDEFKLTQLAILYNYASFNKYNAAEKFKTSLLQNNWDDAVDKILHSTELIDSGKEIFLYVVKNSPDIYSKVYKTLVQNQISEVMETFDGHYIVFQLLEKYDRNEIPNLSIIYDLVKERYIAQQRELAYKSYVKQLYSDYSSSIER